MPSFFTVPASQKKRKRKDTVPAPTTKRRNTNNGTGRNQEKASSRRPDRDESISGSESEDDSRPRRTSDAEDGIGSSSESDHEEETGAERRLRLAERYLENIKGEVDEAGFDAAEIDRDLIAERLKEVVAETKGRLYRRIASDLAFDKASQTQFRADTHSTTSIATCPPYVYTVSKDLTLIKWELPTPPTSLLPPDPSEHPKKNKKPPPPPRRRPTQLVFTKGNKNNSQDPKYQHHTSSILTVAASSDGRFVATGGADKRLIIWSATDLKPLKVFTQHRDAVTGLVFRRGTNQLYSSSKDRTIKTWSLNELAYIETLFGHQDEVVDIATLAQERCLSVGARDRTARLWKVVEETQLVFRGGGGGGAASGDKKSRHLNNGLSTKPASYTEGSIDRVALIDEETFVTGSDNGALSLWNIHKKKPVFTVPLAHGLDPALTPEEAFSDKQPTQDVPGKPQPRWITALATVPYSDLILSGSWDGWVRVWKVVADKRRVEAVGRVGRVGGGRADGHVSNAELDGAEQEPADEGMSVRGVVNDISVFERGERGEDGLCVVVAVGTEHRLGRWKKVKGRNGAVVFEVPRSRLGDVEGLADRRNGDAGQRM
ncbi:MAG: WD40 repeat protein [Lasallia pustulata]|uniref:WD40 repeat protein n=1 Tax=Lasallia pustulata TaxID=136370 RepID=A0A5M8Q1W7_9LECA|nr:MAG: WD40 repeat protein [Lasallia pustulata]